MRQLAPMRSNMSNRRTLAACSLTLVVALSLLFQTSPTSQADTQALWRHRHLGKAHFETQQPCCRAPLELKKASNLLRTHFVTA